MLAGKAGCAVGWVVSFEQMETSTLESTITAPGLLGWLKPYILPARPSCKSFGEASVEPLTGIVFNIAAVSCRTANIASFRWAAVTSASADSCGLSFRGYPKTPFDKLPAFSFPPFLRGRCAFFVA